MPRCLLSVDGTNYDVTNLMNEEGLRTYVSELRLAAMRRQQQQEEQQSQRDTTSTRRRASSASFDWSVPLYPNLNDPCNRRLLQDVVMEDWRSMPLVKDVSQQPEEQSDKYAEFYELQRQDMERMQQQHHLQQQQHDLSHAADYVTALPQRAQTAPLHSQEPPAFGHQTSSASTNNVRRSSGSNAMLSSSNNNTNTPSSSSFTATPRQSLPPVRRPHRHSTTAVPGDIDSSSSGLRPRVNYKSLYSRNCNHSGDSTTGSLGGNSVHDQEDDTTSTTMMSSSRLNHHYDEPLDESPVEEDLEEETSSGGSPTTMEIAPNVRVAVRSSQETYKAVQSGEYTVATCFACASTIVCVDDAAYVLCPDCQVVSPLGFQSGSPHDASKKDDPYGIGTGLKREWVNAWVGSI